VTRLERIQPSGWPEPSGYANALSATGRIVALAGQIGWNPITQSLESDDFVDQARQALHNIADVLRTAGAHTDDVVRLTWYVTDRQAYMASKKTLGTAYREVFGRHFPAMTVVLVAGLLEPRALLEIEATAVITDPE
jgi:enamine deaminase RidA (YjgF/YER057c/UK114 family)